MITLESIKTVNIELNNICNLSCTLCQRNNPEMDYYLKQKNHLDYDALLKTLDKFKNLKNVYLFGNLSEPVLYYNFLNLIKELKKRNLNLTISTNGNPYSETFWKDFGNSLDSNDTCIFAIDGSTQEKYQKYRVGGNLEKVLKNYITFCDWTQAKKAIQIIKFPWLEPIDEEFQTLKAKLNPEDQLKYRFEKIAKLNHTSDTIQTKEDKILNKFHAKVIKRNLLRTKPELNCASQIKDSFMINFLGDIIPCCYVHEELMLARESSKFPIPNIMNYSEKEFNEFFTWYFGEQIFKTENCISTCSKMLQLLKIK